MPVIGTVFGIRKKGTNHWLPEPKGRMGRGGSHVEPSLPQEGHWPRTFPTYKGASNALTQWARGKHHRTTYYESEGWSSYEVEDLPEVIPQPHRNRDDMEVVPIELIAPEPTKER